MKLNLPKFCLYRKLHERLKSKAQNNYKFECSLDLLVVPGVTAKWSSKFCSSVHNDIFKKYCSIKHQGNQGEQEKTFRMLQSR